MTDSEQQIRSNVIILLNLVGNEAKCQDCGVTVWWVQHIKSGKKAPYTCEAKLHILDCPAREQFQPPPVQDRKSLAAGDEQERMF